MRPNQVSHQNPVEQKKILEENRVVTVVEEGTLVFSIRGTMSVETEQQVVDERKKKN